MSQPQEQQTTGTGPRYAEFTGKPMSDLELLALLQKGYSIRQGPNKQGLIMFWLQLPLERRLMVDPAQLERFKRLGWVQPVQSTTGTIWELNRQPPQPPANPKITPIGAKRLPRTKTIQVVDDKDENGENAATGHDNQATPNAAAANPNPCIRLYGPGPANQTCEGCISLLATRVKQVHYKCCKRNIATTGSTHHQPDWDACVKYQNAESISSTTTNTTNQPIGGQGRGHISNAVKHDQPTPTTNTNTNLGA